MANEVNINITATDLTGPAFASVLGKLTALKAATSQIREDLGSLSMPAISISQMQTSLNALRSKIQSMGIADIADVNVPLGRLSVQMQVLKRLINQAGIADILDVSVNTDELNKTLGAIGAEQFSIPITWDTSRLVMPKMGVGPNQPINLQERIIGADQAAADLAALASSWKKAAAAAAVVSPPVSRIDAAMAAANKQFADGIPLWGITVGRWGMLGGKAQLFGGALTAMGIPLIGSIGGVHLLADSILELAATVIPATVALAAFGAGAAPTIGDIYNRMVALNSISTAFGHQIYPMTGAFQKLQNAVQPQVYDLFGQALVIAGHDAGGFTTLAQRAGVVVQQLGARASVALTSGGLKTFLSTGPHDLAMFGNVIANIFGTIGNVIRVLPGYAQTLLSILGAVTGAIEHLTGSSIGQWALGVGLAFHGFIVWAGLAATGAVYLGNGLISLAAKFGLAEAGALAFDAVQFGTGIKLLASYLFDAAVATVTFAGAEEVAAAATGAWDAALIVLDAVNPLVWVGLAAAAIGGLIYMFSRATSATQQYDSAVNKALAAAPVNQLQVQIAAQLYQTISNLDVAQTKLNNTQKFAQQVNLHTGIATQVVTAAWQKQNAVVQGYTGEVATLRGYQSNFNKLLVDAGGNLSFFNQVGITSADILGANKEKLKEYAIELQAANDAQKALNLGMGRNAAALNAENSTFVTDTLPALQKVTQAEDALMNVVLAGPQAFIAFQQSINAMDTAAKATTQGIGGLSNRALTLAADFYTTAVPAAQKLIDSLQQDAIGTGNLTKAIATQSGELLTYAGNNKEARAVIIAMINNALGPGTVGFKNLNSWVAQNKTSIQGLNSIVGTATVKMGSLAGILENDLNVQFHQFLLQTSGADQALKTYTADIVNGTTKTDAGRAARHQLIIDLENAGLTAKQARQYVDNLQLSISQMHGKNVGVGVVGSGAGKLTFAEQALGQNAAGFLEFHAAGGPVGNQGVRRLPGYGGGDQILSMLEPGETIIDKQRSREFAWIFRRMGIPGYQGGGRVGNPQTMVDWMSGTEVSFYKQVEQAWAHQAYVAAEAALRQALAAKARSMSRIGAGPGGGAPAANAALARSMFHPTTEEWVAWNYVAMRESGWNQFADNPTSGAYGIPQALPFSKMPRAAWPASAGGSSNPAAQIGWMWNYMWSRWGGPIGAAANEAAHSWYDTGGWLKPGWNPPMYNGLGRPEHLSPDSGGGSMVLQVIPGGSGIFEQFMAQFIKKYVRTKGGGDVQSAFKGYR